MKKKIFIIISTKYYYKYLTNNSFKHLEKKNKVYYLFKEKNSDNLNLKIKNKIFYKLNKKSSIWVNHFLDYLRYSNSEKCKTFKALQDYDFPNYEGLRQTVKQVNFNQPFFILYLKFALKRLIFDLLSIKFISKFFTNYFYNKIKIEKNLHQIFSSYKPDLVIYPTHSKEPEVIKIKKLSDFYKFKTFYIIDNWDNLSTGTYYKYKPDFIGVWGKQTKMHAIKIHNFLDKNVFLIGNCRFDNYFKMKKKILKKNIKDYILFISCNLRVDEIYYLELLDKIIKKNKRLFKDTKIIYRLHPQAKNYNEIEKLQNLENVILDKSVFQDKKVPYFKNDNSIIKKNYIPLILNAKFLVGLVSSVVIEALIFNKSYLAIAFKNKIDKFYSAKWWFKAFIHFKELQKVDKVNFTFSEKQYENQFIQMFKSKKLDKNFTNTRKQLDYFYHKDKLPYSKRINEIVKKIL